MMVTFLRMTPHSTHAPLLFFDANCTFIITFPLIRGYSLPDFCYLKNNDASRTIDLCFRARVLHPQRYSFEPRLAVTNWYRTTVRLSESAFLFISEHQIPHRKLEISISILNDRLCRDIILRAITEKLVLRTWDPPRRIQPPK